MVVAVAIPTNMDSQPVLVEVTNTDVVASKVITAATDTDILEKPPIGCEVVADDSVKHHSYFRRLLVFIEEFLLLLQGLAG